MLLKAIFKSSNVALAGAFLALAVGSHAQTPGAGVNVLTNPEFYGQTPTFQSTGGPVAAGWTYTPGFDFFGSSLDLVSQSLPTTDLYYYDISFALGTTLGEAGVDFAMFWDQTPVTVMSLPSSDAYANYSFQVTAVGPTSDIGLVGNSAFWSSLDNLDASWTGGIDPSPSVPDASIGFGLEAATLLGLCGVAGLHRRQELLLAPQKTG